MAASAPGCTSVAESHPSIAALHCLSVCCTHCCLCQPWRVLHAQVQQQQRMAWTLLMCCHQHARSAGKSSEAYSCSQHHCESVQPCVGRCCCCCCSQPSRDGLATADRGGCKDTAYACGAEWHLAMAAAPAPHEWGGWRSFSHCHSGSV